MANIQPTFLRRFEMFAPISSARSSSILERVQITLGFNGPVDPMSGMILNLTDIDGWIQSFKDLTGSKKYTSRWALCRFVDSKFKTLIDRPEFSEVHVKFHDFEVAFQNQEIILKWQQTSLISLNNLKWLSPVTLQLRCKSKKWPPVSPVIETKIAKSLKSVHLGKQKWNWPGMAFHKFEYVDPKLGIGVILK